MLRGVGYESNEASVLTNVTSDHLDLQGIHTLPELAEVKATVVPRSTKPDGWVVLNADDPLVAAVVARGPGARRRCSRSKAPREPPAVRRHLARGGRAYVVDATASSSRLEGDRRPTDRRRSAEVPITIGGLARHNVANALAAAGGGPRARARRSPRSRDGLRDFRPSSERSPGRLNLFRLGSRVVIVDFAHNEAGIAAVLDVAEGIAGGAAGRAAPITAIIGTAGDRPDDTLRGIGRIAGQRAQRVAIKETPQVPARPDAASRSSASSLAGVRAGGAPSPTMPVYATETEALRGELTGAGASAAARASPTRRGSSS